MENQSQDRLIQSNRMIGFRRRMLRLMLGLALILGIPAAGGVAVAGQDAYPQFPSTNNGKAHYPDSTSQFGNDTPMDPKRLRLLNAERQKELVSDTDKLLQLAKELNTEISDANSTGMTDAQLRKVTEIAKLARSVKEKMSYTISGYPSFKEPINIHNQ